MSATLTEEGAHIFLPLGPNRLFAAVNNARTQERVKGREIGELVDAVNKLVVQHAVKYVYGTDEKSLKLINENIGKKRLSTLFERLRKYRNAKHAALLG
jgi:hypothetical protein